MDSLQEYAEHWLGHTALRIDTPFLLGAAYEWVKDIEDARPGFASQLRGVALGVLSEPDRLRVHAAIAALAVVGTLQDLSQLASLTELPDSWLAGAARTAIFEIQHRAT